MENFDSVYEDPDIANYIFDYSDNFSLPAYLKEDLDRAIEHKRRAEYRDALLLYATSLVAAYPSHPTIMYSLAKLPLTIGHVSLAYNIFNRIIIIQNALGRNEYIYDCELFKERIEESVGDSYKMLELRKVVSGQQDRFDASSPSLDNPLLMLDKNRKPIQHFEDEYQFLKKIYDNVVYFNRLRP